MTKTKQKEIFVFIAGSTPQIITETIYALAVKKPPVCPDEVYIITTTKGRELVEELLIKKGILRSLSNEYNIPEIKLSEGAFLIPHDSVGTPLEDIRSEEDNERMGDLITGFIREKAKDETSRLHCSLAGGRKTMSFYMGSALQLFGRPWDKLYHVLVTSEFESNRNFFYKPGKDTTIECRLPDGKIKKMNTKHAEISLAELPFIRLSRKINLRSAGFRQLVTEGQGEIETATLQEELTVNLSEHTLMIGNTLIELVPIHLMIYTRFLRQKKEHCKYPDRPYCQECMECFVTLNDLSSREALELMAEDYSLIYGKRSLRKEDLLHKWQEGIQTQVLRQNISKLNSKLNEDLENEILFPLYMVTTKRIYAGSRYGVRVEKGKIRIVD